MPLIKTGDVVADPWKPVDETQPLPPSGPIVVSLARWETDRDALVARGGPLGIRLKSHERVEAIVPDLGCFALIVLEFPSFRDGRPYSSARLLRERYYFSGELRAAGDVLRDQIQFMHRCGFDAFEIADPNGAQEWEKAIAEITVWYQATADGRVPAHGLRQREGGQG
jgi:uncharacterized protein (DUF934 family)